jgi:hypothetical protein
LILNFNSNLIINQLFGRYLKKRKQMKSNFLKTTLLIAIVLFLSQCTKEDHSISKLYFYTSINPAQSQLSLYIDDQYKGELPYLSSQPVCESDSIMEKTIFMNLESGDYRVKAYDMSGKLKSDNKIKFSSSSRSNGGIKGGCEMGGTGDCIIVNLYY